MAQNLASTKQGLGEQVISGELPTIHLPGHKHFQNYKNSLQMYCQKKGFPTPQYHVVEQSNGFLASVTAARRRFQSDVVSASVKESKYQVAFDALVAVGYLQGETFVTATSTSAATGKKRVLEPDTYLVGIKPKRLNKLNEQQVECYRLLHDWSWKEMEKHDVEKRNTVLQTNVMIVIARNMPKSKDRLFNGVLQPISIYAQNSTDEIFACVQSARDKFPHPSLVARNPREDNRQKWLAKQKWNPQSTSQSGKTDRKQQQEQGHSRSGVTNPLKKDSQQQQHQRQPPPQQPLPQQSQYQQFFETGGMDPMTQHRPGYWDFNNSTREMVEPGEMGPPDGLDYFLPTYEQGGSEGFGGRCGRYQPYARDGNGGYRGQR